MINHFYTYTRKAGLLDSMSNNDVAPAGVFTKKKYIRFNVSQLVVLDNWDVKY